jgi:hypothetical protein
MKRVLAALALAATVFGATTGPATADERPYQDGLISSASGGGLVTDNGELNWQIPAGAHDANIRARFILRTNFDLLSPPANTIWVEQPFTLELYDLDSGLLIALDRPSTLYVHYNPSDLGGRSESTLRIARLYDRWVNLASTVDTADHVVIAQTLYSGDYGLLADDVAPAPPAPAPAPAPVPVPAPAPAPAPAQPASPTLPETGGTNSVISGRVFYDKNGNGIFDDGDFPVGGAGLLINFDSRTAFTRTGPDGGYSFGSLGDGSYAVNLVVGPEWAYTTPNEVGDVRVTGQLGSVGIADFGIWLKLPQ